MRYSRGFMIYLLVGLLSCAVTSSAFAGSLTSGKYTLLGGTTSTLGGNSIFELPDDRTIYVIPGLNTNVVWQHAATGFDAPIVNWDYGHAGPAWGDSLNWTVPSGPSRSSLSTSTVTGYVYVAYMDSVMNAICFNPPVTEKFRMFLQPYNYTSTKATLSHNGQASALGSPWGVARHDSGNAYSSGKWGRMNSISGIFASEGYDSVMVSTNSIGRVVLVALWEPLMGVYRYKIRVDSAVHGTPGGRFEPSRDVSMGVSTSLPVVTATFADATRWQEVDWPNLLGPKKLADADFRALKINCAGYEVVAESLDRVQAEAVYDSIEGWNYLDDTGLPSEIDTDTAGAPAVPGWLWNWVQEKVVTVADGWGESLSGLAWPLKAIDDLNSEVN